MPASSLGDATKRRNDVVGLLGKCVNEKVLHGRSEHAIGFAEEAYALAKKSPQVHSPWPQIAAYRLAHLLLRSPKRLQLLDRIDELLHEACDESSFARRQGFSPLPYIYRLAVLHLRLLRAGSDRQKEAIAKEIKSALAVATNVVRASLRLKSAHDENALERHQLQTGAFNLLELATYFLDEPYDVVEATGSDPDAALLFSDRRYGWTIYSNNDCVQPTSTTWDVASEELESLARLYPDALLVVQHPDQLFQWRRGDATEWTNTGDEFSGPLLVTVSRKGRLSRLELGKLLWREAGPQVQTRLRKAVQRMNTRIGTLFGRNAVKPFHENSDPLMWSGEVTVLALVGPTA